jgi:hypothetical protein
MSNFKIYLSQDDYDVGEEWEEIPLGGMEEGMPFSYCVMDPTGYEHYRPFLIETIDYIHNSVILKEL